MINQVGAVKTCEDLITHSCSANSAGRLTVSFPLSGKNSSNILQTRQTKLVNKERDGKNDERETSWR